MLKTTLAIAALTIPLMTSLPAAAGFAVGGASAIWLDADGTTLPELARHGADDPVPHKRGCDSPRDMAKPRCQV